MIGGWFGQAVITAGDIPTRLSCAGRGQTQQARGGYDKIIRHRAKITEGEQAARRQGCPHGALSGHPRLDWCWVRRDGYHASRLESGLKIATSYWGGGGLAATAVDRSARRCRLLPLSSSFVALLASSCCPDTALRSCRIFLFLASAKRQGHFPMARCTQRRFVLSKAHEPTSALAPYPARVNLPTGAATRVSKHKLPISAPCHAGGTSLATVPPPNWDRWRWAPPP